MCNFLQMDMWGHGQKKIQRYLIYEHMHMCERKCACVCVFVCGVSVVCVWSVCARTYSKTFVQLLSLLLTQNN